MNKLFYLILLSCLAFNATAQEKGHILKREVKANKINSVLVKDFSELGFPGYGDRAFWNSLPDKFKSHYIGEAEAALDYDWPTIKATDYLEIVRTGDRRQNLFSEPRAVLTALVMGELVEGKGRFLDQIVNGIWFYNEQTWWGWSAHLYMQKAYGGLPDADEPTIDLGVGEVANLLSWTYFLFKEELDKIHPLIAIRLKAEVMEKVLEPYYLRSDFWWQGFVPVDIYSRVNNWNPWTNHNILTAILILEKDSVNRLAGVKKVVKSLDEFLNDYPADGGCDEGPSYWGRAGASLFQNIDLLHRATRGVLDVYDHPLVQNIGNFIYKAYIDYPYFINFADADATTGSRPSIVYRYGKAINDPVMQQFGVFLAQKEDFGQQIPKGKIDEQIMQLMYLEEINKAPAKNALIPDFWLPETEVAGARDKAGSSEGFFFAAKGGHNEESHNHNDLGTCVLYYDGLPCLIDIGRETYSAKTFSDDRYDIWTMQSAYHQLPKINGVDQKNGEKYKAKNTSFLADEKKAVFSTDIAGAYPDSAAVEKWIRTYTLDRGRQFTISDNWELKELAAEPTSLNFITYCKVTEKEKGILNLKGEGFELKMKYNPRSVFPKIEFMEVNDAKLKRYWPKGIIRIVFELKKPALKGKNEVLIFK